MPKLTHVIYINKVKTRFLCIVLTLCCCSVSFSRRVPAKKPSSKKDSLATWIESAKKSPSLQEKKLFLGKAHKALAFIPNDSDKLTYLNKLSNRYLSIGDTVAFLKLNKEGVKLATQLEEGNMLAGFYWDRGFYLSQNTSKADSAYRCYYQAKKIYEKEEMEYEKASVILNIAILQTSSRDYLGSEVATVEAIQIFRAERKYKELYHCFNNLAIVANEVGDYKTALKHHQKALYYLNKGGGNRYLEATTLNNIGVVYEYQQQYEEALAQYQVAKTYNEKYAKNKEVEAMIIDNTAYSLFKLGQKQEVLPMFTRALQLRDSLGFAPGIIINNLHLAEYYASVSDTAQAITHAKAAHELAAASQNYKYVLSSLWSLSGWDAASAATYLKEYVQLSEHLQKTDKEIRDKFATIRLDADGLLSQNRRLALFNYVQMFLLAVVSVFSFLIIKEFKHNIRELRKRQRKYDEEIYDLMLLQHDKLEEGRAMEKKRISEELHDGVLGKLFGLRMNLEILNGKTDEESCQRRLKYIAEIKEVERDIRNLSHNLHQGAFFSKADFLTLVEDLLEKQSAPANLTYRLWNNGGIIWKDIFPSTKMNLYRIIQESVTNTIKYAEAKTICVNFLKKDDDVIMSVGDDGVGFDVNGKPTGIGHKNIRSRCEFIKGDVKITSLKDKGTFIVIQFSIKQNSLAHEKPV